MDRKNVDNDNLVIFLSALLVSYDSKAFRLTMKMIMTMMAAQTRKSWGIYVLFGVLNIPFNIFPFIVNVAVLPPLICPPKTKAKKIMKKWHKTKQCKNLKMILKNLLSTQFLKFKSVQTEREHKILFFMVKLLDVPLFPGGRCEP